MKIKAERTVAGPWHPAIHFAADVIDRVWRHETGQHPRITGLGEEGHSEGSLHYGIPGDIRCRALDVDADNSRVTQAQKDRIDQKLRARLGSEFDLVWERMGTVHAHLHCEFQPEPIE